MFFRTVCALALSIFLVGSLGLAQAQNIDGLKVDENGNVGVGHASPNERLDVKGKVHLGEVPAPVPSWATAMITGQNVAKLLLMSHGTSGGSPSVLILDHAQLPYKTVLGMERIGSNQAQSYLRQRRDGYWHDQIMMMPDLSLHFQQRKSAISPHDFGGIVFHEDVEFKQKIGIGTDTPSHPLHVASGPARAEYFISDHGHRFRNSEQYDYKDSYKADSFTHLFWDRNNGGGPFMNGNQPQFFYWDTDTNRFNYLIDSGNMENLEAVFNTVTTTSLTETSSRRFKTDVRPIDGASSLLAQLNGVRYRWSETGRPDLGFIAEDVGKVLPELVRYEENGTDAKSLDYSHLTAVLVEALKEEQSRVQKLEDRVQALEARADDVDALRQEVEALRTMLLENAGAE